MEDKQVLANNLAKIITENRNNDLVIKRMQEIYVQKNLPVSTVGLAFKGGKPITSIFEIELGVWCIGLYDITKNPLLNPETYFSEREIYEIRDYVNKDEADMDTKDLIFENVEERIIKGRLFYFVPFVSVYDIYRFNKSSLITYNYETQREARLTRYNGRIVKQESVNLESVEDIATLVEADEMPPSMLTLNIRKPKFDESSVKYNAKTRQLKITPSLQNEVFTDTIDGYHRLLGISKGTFRARQANKELTCGVMMLISNYSIEDAQNYISIQNKQNAIKDELTKAYAKDEFNEFVKAINYEGSESKNIMYDKIANTVEELEMYKKYTTVKVLHNSLKFTGLNFKKPHINENKYMPHFIYIFNTILGYYMDKYDYDVENLKNETITLEANVFSGYIAIGNQLIGKENKKEILIDLLENNKINLNRNAYDWESLDMFKKNPKTYKKIYDYFYKIVGEEN